MPEFELNTAGAGAPWESLGDFTKGFIEAAFFTSDSSMESDEFFAPDGQKLVEAGQADGDIPSDSNVAQIDAESFCKVKNFCDEFETRAADLLALAYGREYDERQAGRDLYFTHAGHGVGYWDRDALDAGGLGDKLTEAAGRGEINLMAYESDKTPDGFLIEFYLG